MSCYFIAQIKIRDAAEYEKYLAGADAVFAKFNGEYLAVDKSPVVLEGSWDYSRIALIRFPSEADLMRWYSSPEYREILTYRLNAADCDTLLVRGIDETP